MINKLLTRSDYQKKSSWGLLTSIDLFNCNYKLIRDRKVIKQYIIELCELIDMKRFGKPIIARFGTDPRVQGYSAVQLIETSCISGHFAEDSNSAYIDIFSCKWYDQKKTIDFTKKFFKAKIVSYKVIPRGIGIIK